MLDRNEDVEKKYYYKIDWEVIGDTARDNDYKKLNGFDKSHLVPQEDMAFEEGPYEGTRLMSLICPMYEEFNRNNMWSELENQVRVWTREYGEVYVICGPVFNGSNSNSKGFEKERKIAIPEFYFKVIMFRTPDLRVFGFLFAHKDESKKEGDELSNYDETVKYIEEKTGYDFFSGLPDFIENDIETANDFDEWFYEESLTEEVSNE
jgi:endonuclease G